MNRVHLTVSFAVVGLLALPAVAGADAPTFGDANPSANKAHVSEWAGPTDPAAAEYTPTFSNDVGAPSSGAGSQLYVALIVLGIGGVALIYGFMGVASARPRPARRSSTRAPRAVKAPAA